MLQLKSHATYARKNTLLPMTIVLTYTRFVLLEIESFTTDTMLT
jgi:hypothetical protein